VALLVGQQIAVDLQLAPAAVAETITVTGEAPLIDTTGSTIGANIDPRQMQELPINGRNWMDLTLLAPGARRNESGGLVQFRQGYAQTNVDGQQMTINYHSQTDTEQPGISRDAIAEFEVIANRFDATQGRSSGMIVNAVTKSGTNQVSGSVFHFQRLEALTGKLSDGSSLDQFHREQFGGTIGGPLRRDRAFFFVALEGITGNFERPNLSRPIGTPCPVAAPTRELPASPRRAPTSTTASSLCWTSSGPRARASSVIRAPTPPMAQISWARRRRITTSPCAATRSSWSRATRRGAAS
jgi:hypothetical protein